MDAKREQATDSLISAIRLQISVNEIKCCRKIALKGLYGDNARLQEFTNTFVARVTDCVNNMPEEKR